MTRAIGPSPGASLSTPIMCWTAGAIYAKVLPDPVWATPMMSRPANAKGQACIWMGGYDGFTVMNRALFAKLLQIKGSGREKASCSSGQRSGKGLLQFRAAVGKRPLLQFRAAVGKAAIGKWPQSGSGARLVTLS